MAIDPANWFGSDFAAGGGSLATFVVRYVATPDRVDALNHQRGQIGFLEYDWTLNVQDGQGVS